MRYEDPQLLNMLTWSCLKRCEGMEAGMETGMETCMETGTESMSGTETQDWRR